MQIERFYLGCLAHASYLVYDAGEAAVIDPQRDVDIYIEALQRLNLTLRWVMKPTSTPGFANVVNLTGGYDAYALAH